MPEEFQHTHDLISRRRFRSPKGESDAASVDDSADAQNHPVDSKLAQFSLLADPATISGQSDNEIGKTTATAASEEINRLRSALNVQSRELAELQSQPESNAASSAQAHLPALLEATSEFAPLLNSTQARKLADDAREREKVIRAELSDAQKALESEPALPERPSPPPQQWKRRELVTAKTPIGQDNQSALGEGALAPNKTSHNVELIAARAEMRELTATLAMARETTASQKTEIARLRGQLEEAQRTLPPTHDLDPTANPSASASAENPIDSEAADPNMQRLLGEAVSETARLRDRIQFNQRESDMRNTERLSLKRNLEEQESELAGRRTQLEDLQDRFDAQDQALDNARSQYELERSQNSETQELLAQLRRTLAPNADSDTDTAPSAYSAASPTEEASPIFAAEREAKIGAAVEIDATPIQAEQENESDRDRLHQADGSMASQAEWGRPSLFDNWQDEQILRNFGPMGIDTIVDLLRAPLARRSDRGTKEQHLALLGRGAWSWAAILVEGLIQNGIPPFTLHIADPTERSTVGLERIALNSPIREFVRELPDPDSPKALTDCLEQLDPSAIILRDFLSHQEAVGPWLDVLSEASSKGACLLFSERTGVGPVPAPEEARTMGDRIWNLMPQRYTQIPESSERIESWTEAYQKTEVTPKNNLLIEMRSRFQLEMLAQFGFLAEPFIGTLIGNNFEPDAPRDRKFLSQVADLDDRKIEAGVVPPLHLVAIVDFEADV